MLSSSLPAPEEASALLARTLAADARAARRLTEHVLLPVLDAAISRRLAVRRTHGFEKHDVIQEVFHHLYENDWARLRGFDPDRGSVASYVWAIAEKWLRDHSRRLPPPRAVDDFEGELSPDSGPERRAALGQLIDRIQDSLSDEEIALFQWVYLEGASHGDITARLDIKVEAVHKRVQRLEAKIRAIVSGDGDEAKKKGGVA
ncbi:MAG: sigma-70 family RNA polymerase sigma factor [Polyangiaceae bacterium]